MPTTHPVKRTTRDRVRFQVGPDEYREWVGPKDKWQLRHWVQTFFGLTVPSEAICEGHSAPLDAMWASYSAVDPVVVWKASRGLGGKSTQMGGLSLIELADGMDVVVLGGSARQSKRVHEVESEAWKHKVDVGEGVFLDGPLQALLAEEPTSYSTRTKNGNTLVAIAASQKSARGPHPQRLRIDEVDELDYEIFNAAMGQPMEGRGFKSQTTISSTHQYPDGTMTKVLALAKERGWPVFEWCYKESAGPSGWLSQSQIEVSRATVSRRMWEIEFELQEPNPEDRLLSTDDVMALFSGRELEDRPGRLYEFENPQFNGLYATGADWGKTLDWTIIWTWRYDCDPIRLVSYERIQREAWPIMVRRFEKRLRKWKGIGVHDAHGNGSVVADIVDPELDILHYVATGERHTKLYADYISAIEQHKFSAARLDTPFTEHKNAGYDDVYMGGGHPPDTVSAAALAYQGVRGRRQTDMINRRPGRVRRVLTF